MRSACFFIECPITGMVLGVSRKDDPTAFGLPGGKVEDGEDELQAAVRELQEETGVELYKMRSWYPEIFRREGGVTFRATTGQMREVHPVKEPGRVAWVTPEQLINGPFGEYNRKLLATAFGREFAACRCCGGVPPRDDCDECGARA